ncbi:Hpt domain-containing protein [Roseovarius salinarum]|uniref:Hpt domain-containing protein n=1 Tax=Roseovarius salinarum TaxID=1981892 RepID=UPI000C31DA58|nr:Hpt domain-containing protein [Roseovarius salinarum]
MIDWGRLEELRDEIGDDDFAEVVALFLEEVETEIATLEEGMPAQVLEQKLHFLKGSALNLGFRSFAELCLEGERQAAADEPGPVDLDAARQCFATSRSILLSAIERTSDG